MLKHKFRKKKHNKIFFLIVFDIFYSNIEKIINASEKSMRWSPHNLRVIDLFHL